MIYQEKISLPKRTIEITKEYAGSFPADLVKVKPDEKAFSAMEIIYHLLEVEELWQRRIHQLLHEEMPTFQRIDPDELASVNRYNEQDYEAGIEAWSESREETISLVEEMTEDELLKKGTHSYFGEIDTYRIMGIMADHDLQHLSQMKRTLQKITNKD